MRTINGKEYPDCLGGAHTTRWSGGDGVNWQNLPKKGGIRPAIHAPPGMVIGKLMRGEV
jgi:hypothetical protein